MKYAGITVCDERILTCQPKEVYTYNLSYYAGDAAKTVNFRGLKLLIEFCAQNGLTGVFCMDSFVLYALDKIAVDERLPLFDDLNDNTGRRKKLNVDMAYSYRDSDIIDLSRKVWIRTEKANGKKTLTAVSFYNFSHMVGKSDNIYDFGGGCCSFIERIYKFNEYFQKLTGVPFLGDKRPAAWTIGGAARAAYFRLKFPNYKGNLLKAYHASHPQNRAFDEDLREYGALMPGLLYVKDNNTHAACVKYDVNSAFPAIVKEVGEITAIKVSKITKGCKYLYKIKNFLAVAKNKYAAPYGAKIDLQNVYLFSEWIDEIRYFYDVIDLDVKDIYVLINRTDVAVNEYIDKLYEAKSKATSTGHKMIAKLFLNNLHGKFLQHTLTRDYRLEYDNNGVLAKKYSEYRDNWETSHFDYLRGAYIYMRSNVEILRLWRTVSKELNLPISAVIYVDTDCLIIEGVPSADAKKFDSRELGQLKLEDKFSFFKAYEKKCYFGLKRSLNLKIVCAGLNPSILNDTACREYFGKDNNLENNVFIFDRINEILTNPAFRIYQKEVHRAANDYGASYMYVEKKFTANPEEQI